MGGCTLAWIRRIAGEIHPRYPNVLVLIARAYHQPKTIDRPDGRGQITIPGVEPDPRGFPLKYVGKFLAENYGPAEPLHDLIILFHPAGGFSWIRQRETPDHC